MLEPYPTCKRRLPNVDMVIGLMPIEIYCLGFTVSIFPSIPLHEIDIPRSISRADISDGREFKFPVQTQYSTSNFNLTGRENANRHSPLTPTSPELSLTSGLVSETE